MRLPSQTVMLGAGALLLVAVVYVTWRGGVKNAAADVTGAVIDAGAGTVIGVGEAFGIPRTDVDRCALAKAQNNIGDIAAYCPALDYIKAVPGIPAAVWNDLKRLLG